MLFMLIVILPLMVFMVIFGVQVGVAGNVIIVGAAVETIHMEGKLAAAQIQPSGGEFLVRRGIALCGGASAIAVLGDCLGYGG